MNTLYKSNIFVGYVSGNIVSFWAKLNIPQLYNSGILGDLLRICKLLLYAWLCPPLQYPFMTRCVPRIYIYTQQFCSEACPGFFSSEADLILAISGSIHICIGGRNLLFQISPGAYAREKILLTAKFLILLLLEISGF